MLSGVDIGGYLHSLQEGIRYGSKALNSVRSFNIAQPYRHGRVKGNAYSHPYNYIE